MSYNGSGTFQINTSGQPVVTGTSISSTVFNALTADLATGLSTAITKDGQTTTTARIPFALGINSTLVTDATNTTSGSIITAGGVGIAKALYVGTTANVAGAVTLQNALSVTGVTTVQAGTAALPAITTTGDTNTGIFFPAADTIAFAEGGAEVARFDSSGNLGVGVTPSAWNTYKALEIGTVGNSISGGVSATILNLTNNAYYSTVAPSGWKYANTTTGASLFQTSGGAYYWYINNTSGTAGNAITFTQAMTLTAAGDLGVGTTSPARKLDVNGSIQLPANHALYINSSSNYLYADASALELASATQIKLVANGTLRATIDSSGNLLVGTTTAGGSGITLVDGKYIYSLGTYNNTTGAAANMGVDSTAGIFYRSTSSLKYKRDVQNYEKGLAEVMQLRPVYYKGTSERDGDTQYAGLIAEEVHEIGLTEFVQYAEDKTPDALAYGHMISLAFKAIQEQQALIQTLTARITALESA